MSDEDSIEKILKGRAQLIDQYIEKYIPREYREDSLMFGLDPPKYTPDFEALGKAVSEPFWEFLERGGKRWRPVLFLLVCEALGANPQECLDFAVIPEVIHNGTLIADDIEDSSELRRGKPCIHELFGDDIAINLSALMYFLPMKALRQKAEKVPNEKARRLYDIYIQEMINLGLGQAIDIAWHKGLTPADKVTESQYLQMCAYKTGTLARMAAQMAAVLSDADNDTVEKMGRFAESIGIAFQIQDDILDLVGEEFAKGKGGPGMDITEGKLTLMVVHTLQKADSTDKKELETILDRHTRNKRLRKKAIEIIGKYGSIAYASDLASKMVSDSWSEVDEALLPSEAKEKLRSLADHLIKREI